MMDIAAAVDLFWRCCTRQYRAHWGTKNYRINDLRVVEYAQLLYGAPYEINVTDEPADQVMAVVHQLPERCWILVFTPDMAASQMAYAAYNLAVDDEIERMMWRSLEPLPHKPPIPVQQVTTPAQLEALCLAREVRMFDWADFASGDVIMCYASVDDQPAAWGAAIFLNPGVAYIAWMFTRPEYRQRGLAAAVLTQLMHLSAERGAVESLLVASPMGLNVYEHLGYSRLCDLMVLGESA